LISNPYVGKFDSIEHKELELSALDGAGGETSGTRMAFTAAIAAEKTVSPLLAVFCQLPTRAGPQNLLYPREIYTLFCQRFIIEAKTKQLQGN